MGLDTSETKENVHAASVSLGREAYIGTCTMAMTKPITTNPTKSLGQSENSSDWKRVVGSGLAGRTPQPGHSSARAASFSWYSETSSGKISGV